MARVTLIADTHISPVWGAASINLWLAADMVRAGRADQIVHLGDVVFSDYSKTELAFAQALFASLNLPLLAIPGNHDVGEPPVVAASDYVQPGHVSTLATVDRSRAFYDVFGPLPQTLLLDDGDTALVLIDSQQLGTGSELEAATLEMIAGLRDLQASTLVIATHKTLGLVMPELDQPGWTIPAAPSEQILRHLARRRTDQRVLVVSGHFHRWRQYRVEGIHFVWVPTLAFITPHRLLDARGGEPAVGYVDIDTSAGQVPQVHWRTSPAMPIIDISGWVDAGGPQQKAEVLRAAEAQLAFAAAYQSNER
ncbi:MAG: metallophosphoesterase [Pseudomonadota bacterium]